MSSLHILSVLFSVTLCEAKLKVVKEAYYSKPPGETTSAVQLLECGVKYAHEQFGVFKVNEDGTECFTEPWSWFDTQATATGYTHYKKSRMTLTWELPVSYRQTRINAGLYPT